MRKDPEDVLRRRVNRLKVRRNAALNTIEEGQQRLGKVKVEIVSAMADAVQAGIFTQAEIAEILGVHPNTVTQYKREVEGGSQRQ